MYYSIENYKDTTVGQKVTEHAEFASITRSAEEAIPKNTFTALGLMAAPVSNPSSLLLFPNVGKSAVSLMLALSEWFHEHPECDAEAYEYIKEYLDN